MKCKKCGKELGYRAASKGKSLCKRCFANLRYVCGAFVSDKDLNKAEDKMEIVLQEGV